MSRKTDVEKHYCRECALATPITKHFMLDHSGKPFCYSCPHSKGARIENELSCEFFKPRSR